MQSSKNINNENFHPHELSLLILLPVFNDWQSLAMLCKMIDEELTKAGRSADILVINDGSSEPLAADYWAKLRFSSIHRIELMELARNLGHQRALAIGIAYVQRAKQHQAIVIMDADGEDNPADIPRLLETFCRQNQAKIIFAERAKRAEKFSFILFYYIYRMIFFFLTGTKVRFGNFSVIPHSLLPKLVAISEIWNHYAAAIMKAKIPYELVSVARQSRLSGSSKMNFVALVIHGLSAISVHSDTIGVRTLVAMSLVGLTAGLGISVVVLIRAFTTLAIPGWASFVTLSFLILLMQSLLVALVFVFIVLNNRSSLGFIPRRDYKHFVLSVKEVYFQNE